MSHCFLPPPPPLLQLVPEGTLFEPHNIISDSCRYMYMYCMNTIHVCGARLHVHVNLCIAIYMYFDIVCFVCVCLCVHVTIPKSVLKHLCCLSTSVVSLPTLSTPSSSSTSSPAPSPSPSEPNQYLVGSVAEDAMSHVGQKSQKQVPKLLSMGAIAAQEQQVSALRELLKQEESRLDMLKKAKGDQSQGAATQHLSNSHTKPSDALIQTTVGGVIHTNSVSTASSNASNRGHASSRQTRLPPQQQQQVQLHGPGMSSRLQQLVESVAVDQLSSQTSKLKQSIHVQQQNLLNTTSLLSHTLKMQLANQKAGSPEVITISDSPSPMSPPPLTSVQSNPPMAIQVPTISSGQQLLKLDESAILRAIENSRRYKEFMMKQANSKRVFQKQIEKRIATAPYPKTFRQVWPIIPVHDPSFIKSLGLETVTMFFDPRWRTELAKPPPASKVKPICNQCGCDFASAWQIRKNNAKQVLLCESCDFANLKLLQRTKLAGQLKELVESIRTDEEKFSGECEDARKKMVASERQAILASQGLTRAVTNSQKSVITQQPGLTKTTAVASKTTVVPTLTQYPSSNHLSTASELVSVLKPDTKVTPSATLSQAVIPSILPSQVSQDGDKRLSTTPVSQSMAKETPESSRKRKHEDKDPGSGRKAAKGSPNLDQTLNRITEQLLRKQVDEKCKEQNHEPQHQASPPPPPPPPPPAAVPLAEAARPTISADSAGGGPPSITAVTNSSSRKSRRKGNPRQNRHLSNSSATD